MSHDCECPTCGQWHPSEDTKCTECERLRSLLPSADMLEEAAKKLDRLTELFGDTNTKGAQDLAASLRAAGAKIRSEGTK